MIGSRIRDARKKAGLTQEELAKAIGVKRSVISKYENGQVHPSYQTVERISQVLNCNELSTSQYIDFLYSEDIEKGVEGAKKKLIENKPHLSIDNIDDVLVAYRIGCAQVLGVLPPSSEILVSLGFTKDVADLIMQISRLSDEARNELLSKYGKP